MKQIDNRQKELIQLRAQKGHLLSFRDKSHLRSETPPSAKQTPKQNPKEESEKQAKEEGRPAPASPSSKVGRNEPCPCGSGKKYKKCCLGKS